VRRIFNCNKIQDNILLQIKYWTFWYWPSFCVIIQAYTSCKLLKMVLTITNGTFHSRCFFIFVLGLMLCSVSWLINTDDDEDDEVFMAHPVEWLGKIRCMTNVVWCLTEQRRELLWRCFLCLDSLEFSSPSNRKAVQLLSLLTVSSTL